MITLILSAMLVAEPITEPLTEITYNPYEWDQIEYAEDGIGDNADTVYQGDVGAVAKVEEPPESTKK